MLRDILRADLDAVFVGINPGLRSAELGHHFAGHSNRFWKLIYEAGLVPRRLNFVEDRSLLDHRLGLTNIVDRATRSADELTPEDFRLGRTRLLRKLKKNRPRFVALVGIVVCRALFERRGPIIVGLQPETIGDARVFVVPNPSGRNAHFPYPAMLDAYRALQRTLKATSK